MKKRICLDLGEDTVKAGSIKRKYGSSKLYVSFYYFGKRIEKSTGLDDTRENRRTVRDWLDRVIDKIEDGTFKFAEAFPGATQKEKAFFAQREGWIYNPEPQNVFIGDYIKAWMEKICEHYPSETKKRDYKRIIDAWLYPYFEDLTFYQLTRVEVQKFIAQLKRQKGKDKGKPLSRSRINNILIPLRAIWNDACDEHHWDLSDPFRNLGRLLPRSVVKKRTVFRFDEWMQLIDNLDPHYRNIAEFMLLTGMIASEVAGLWKEDIQDGVIDIQHSIVMGQEKETLKTPYRIRRLPITHAIKERLDKAAEASEGKHLFTMHTGRTFREGSFRQNHWKKAFKKAGLEHKVPYTMRHTFAAWALTIGIDPNRLVKLMGHGSKKMIYEVYGEYVNGLEEDRLKILNYFGQDFLDPKYNTHPLAHRRGWGKSGESQHLRLVK